MFRSKLERNHILVFPRGSSVGQSGAEQGKAWLAFQFQSKRVLSPCQPAVQLKDWLPAGGFEGEHRSFIVACHHWSHCSDFEVITTQPTAHKYADTLEPFVSVEFTCWKIWPHQIGVKVEKFRNMMQQKESSTRMLFCQVKSSNQRFWWIQI